MPCWPHASGHCNSFLNFFSFKLSVSFSWGKGESVYFGAEYTPIPSTKTMPKIPTKLQICLAKCNHLLRVCSYTHRHPGRHCCCPCCCICVTPHFAVSKISNAFPPLPSKRITFLDKRNAAGSYQVVKSAPTCAKQRCLLSHSTFPFSMQQSVTFELQEYAAEDRDKIASHKGNSSQSKKNEMQCLAWKTSVSNTVT